VAAHFPGVVLPRRVQPRHHDAAFRRQKQRVDQFRQRGFPAAVVSENRHELALFDAHRDAVHRHFLVFAITIANVFHFDNGHRFTPMIQGVSLYHFHVKIAAIRAIYFCALDRLTILGYIVLWYSSVFIVIF